MHEGQVTAHEVLEEVIDGLPDQLLGFEQLLVQRVSDGQFVARWTDVAGEVDSCIVNVAIPGPDPSGASGERSATPEGGGPWPR